MNGARSSSSSLTSETNAARLIDGGNLTINTQTLTYANIENYSNSESSNFALNVQVGRSPNNPTLPGQLRLDIALNGNNSSSTTNATIGSGNITTGTNITFANDNTNLNSDNFVNYGNVENVSGGVLNDLSVLGDAASAVSKSSSSPSLTSSPPPSSSTTILNRNINKTESNNRNIITSDFDATIRIDTRLIIGAIQGIGSVATSAASTIAGVVGADNAELRLAAASYDLGNGASGNVGGVWGEVKDGAKVTSDVLFGTNLIGPKVSESGTLSKDAVPATPVWASRVIDESNNEVKDGEPVNHPAPNLLTGLWPDVVGGKLENPGVGRSDEGCASNTLCRETISDQAYHLQALYYGIPGFKSASQFHDAGMLNPDGTEKSGAYKFVSIFPYFILNYYGAIGTIVDAKNWNWNKTSPQNNINFNPVLKYDKKSE